MELKEKILIFRTCGMVLWVLKQIVSNSTRINEQQKIKVIEKINSLIKPLTTHINELQQQYQNNE